MTRIKIEGTDHWHELRRQHVGASEVGALFGVHPQLTRWELHHIKAGTLDAPDLSDNDRVLWGQIVEPAIAAGVERLHGWSLQNVRVYHSDDAGLGATLDYRRIKAGDKNGPVDMKNVDRLVRRDWEGDEPPIHLLLQVQAQMALTGAKWGALACLIGGNELEIHEYDRHQPTIDKIKREVTAFWQEVRNGTPPTPDFQRDAARVAELYGQPTPRTVDLSGHNRIQQLLETERLASERKNQWDKAQQAAKAEILDALGDATHAHLPDGRVLEVGVVNYKAATIEKPAGSYRKTPKIHDADKAKLPDKQKETA
jgi:putative phage-type endonuclease